MKKRSESRPRRKRSAKDLTERAGTSVQGGALSHDDRPTEEVAFYYNKIAFNYAPTADGK